MQTEMMAKFQAEMEKAAEDAAKAKKDAEKAKKEGGKEGGKGKDKKEKQEEEDEGPDDSRQLRNQFNFSERAAQTTNFPMRDTGTYTEPPPTATASGKCGADRCI